MPKPPNKGGRPAKIGEKQEAEIIACLTVGASLRDCADYIGVDYKTLYRKRRDDPGFANRLKAAVKRGKIHHLNKIGKAPQWQASAFMLERKWWKEYGRKDKQDVSVKSQVTHTHTLSEDVRRLIEDREALELANSLGRRMARHPGGPGEPVN